MGYGDITLILKDSAGRTEVRKAGIGAAEAMVHSIGLIRGDADAALAAAAAGGSEAMAAPTGYGLLLVDAGERLIWSHQGRFTPGIERVAPHVDFLDRGSASPEDEAAYGPLLAAGLYHAIEVGGGDGDVPEGERVRRALTSAPRRDADVTELARWWGRREAAWQAGESRTRMAGLAIAMGRWSVGRLPMNPQGAAAARDRVADAGIPPDAAGTEAWERWTRDLG